MPRPGDEDDEFVTLRLSRRAVAFVYAAVLHAALLALVALLPEPPRREQRVEVTVRRPPPPTPPAASSPRPARPASPPRASPTPPAPLPVSPVVPVLPPSLAPPDNAAVLPLVERAPDPRQPLPPPVPTAPPSSWRERLLSSLATPPRPRDDVLPPSFKTLDRVVAADARLHDDKNEERLVFDYGPFFRRGLEALRATWHPDDVLRADRDDEVRRCARETRTTLAVAVIDRAGNVVDVELKRPSGCAGLDGEALAAFRRVARFPHPPPGLFVDGVGAPSDTARLPVRFIVSFDGSVQLDWR
ncbi:MAG: energy transducer TonB [Deltaproteobacteria bacterium]|nr:energy transducer TonB [Deltaproteobacteria bacterium]